MDKSNTESAGKTSKPLENEPTRILQQTETRILSSSEHLVNPSPITIGSVINNRFVLTKNLGVGGMGIVYQALDKLQQEAHDENPYIAIKILTNEFKQYPQAFVALQREAKRTQKLAHPNILTVYNFDRQGDDFYMTMEELSGTDLAAFIKNNPLGITIERAKKIINSIVKGLSYAHSKNIVHSDLKPSNIFIDKNDEIKILDFGIAKAISQTMPASDDKTLNEKTLFAVENLGAYTPSYASLEMINGLTPSPSDDIYALGLICYELLTGKHPFNRKPADIVKQQKMRLKPITKLKKYQWQAIANSLAIEREARTKNTEQFFEKFYGPRMPYTAVIVGLTIVIIVFVLYNMLRTPPNDPDIAFDNLQIELQTEITAELNRAKESFEFDDLNAALYHFNNAYQLHPKNPDAERGLDLVIDKVLLNLNSNSSTNSNDSSNNTELGQQETDRKLQQVIALLAYPSLQDHQDLIKTKEKLEKKLNNGP